MLSWLTSHRLVVVILLISMVLLSTVVGQDKSKRWRRKNRRINCAVYVFAPRCRGVSAKRSSSSFSQPSFPVTKDIPEVYQLFDNSPRKEEEEDDSLSPLPGLVVPGSFSHQPASLSNPRLLQRQQQQQQQLQKQPSLRHLLQLLLQRNERESEEDTNNNSQWRFNLLQELKRKRRQVSSEGLSNDVIQYDFRAGKTSRQ